MKQLKRVLFDIIQLHITRQRIITMKTLLSLVLLLSAIGTLTHANDDIFSDELPIVISASRLNQSVLTSPTSVTVIDKAMINASGFIELVDILRLVPGFQVANIDSRRGSAVYHGYGSDIPNRLQVLVNGRSTYTPTLSIVDWDLLGVQIEDIERIEVVRGPSASAFGSNSFTAAVNIITTQPSLDNTLDIASRIGNKGEKNQLLRHSGNTGNIDYRLTAAVRRNDGFDNIRDFRKLGHFNLHANINNPNNPIDIYLAYTDGSTGISTSQNDLQERDREVTSWSAHITGEKVISSNKDIKWSVYHNSDDIYDLAESFLLSDILGFSLGPLDQRVVAGTETNDATKTDAEIIYSHSAASNTQYIVGAGVRYDTLKSLSYFKEDGKKTDTTYRIFGNGQIELSESLTLNAGFIYENTKGYGAKTSPRISFNQRILENQSLRLSAARGYRFPSLLEKNFNTRISLDNGFVLDELFISDDSINTEKITSIDIGYLGKLSTFPLSWDARLYKENTTNGIDFITDQSINDFRGDFVSRVSNGTSHRTYGIEGELTYRPRTNSFLRFHFNRGHSKTEETKLINPTQKSTTTEGQPRESYGLLGSFEYSGWQMSLGAYHVGQIQWFGLGTAVDNYTRIDTSIHKRIRLNQHGELTVKLAAQSFNSDHIEFNRAVEFEPRYYITLSLSNL